MDNELNILVIDDSETDAVLVMREVTRSLSATYERVKNAEELASVLDGRKWDIIICDYIIPGFSAFTALQMVKDKKLDIPFIVVSGKVDEAIAVDVMKAGADDYILKDKLGRLVPVIKRELKELESRVQRRKAEINLEESNKRYLDICENANDLIFLARTDGRLIYTSPSFQITTNYGKEALINMKLNDIIDDESVAVWRSLTAKILSDEKTGRVEFRLITKNKSIVYVEGDCGGQRDSSGKVLIRGLLRDITERKKTEEMWAKYKAIVNASSEFMSMVNCEYKYEAVNDAFCGTVGKQRQDILGKTVVEIWGKAPFVSAIKSNIDKCFEGDIVKYKEWMEFPALGRRYHEVSLFPYVENNKVANAVIVTKDITELEKTEEKRKQYIANLSFISKAAMGFIELDAASGVYDYIAERLIELLPSAIVIVGAFQKDISVHKIMAVKGDKENLKKAVELIGENSFKMPFAVSKESTKLLSKGKLIKCEGGIFEVAGSVLPENVCRMAERLLNINSVYSIGIFKKGEMFGNAVIFTKEELSLETMAIIETFVNQAAVALLRRSAEEELKDSAARMNILFDLAPDAYCLCDSERNMITCNVAFEKITGYKKEDLLNKDACGFLIRPDDLSQLFNSKNIDCQKTGFINKECVIKRQDGKDLAVEVSNYPVKIDSKQHALFIYRDISERMKFIDEIRQLAKFVYENPAPMLRISGDGMLIYANPVGMKILNQLKFEVCKAVPKHWMEMVTEVLASGKKRIIELGLMDQTFSFEVVPLTEAGYVNLYGRDITESKTAERALRESEQKYRSLFEDSKDMVFISALGGKFKDINQAGIELLGYKTKEEMFNVNLQQDLYVNSQDRIKFTARLEEHGFVKDYVANVRAKDGKMLVVLITANLIRDSIGNNVEVRGIMKDITELRKLEAQFLHSAKMESLGMLAGGIAHDFNNLLTGIIGNVFELKNCLNDRKECMEDILGIEESANSAAALTSQLLMFARGGKSSISVMNINDVAANTAMLVSRTFKSGIEVTTELEEGIALIEADAVQIGQVVMNLCVNARDAMSSGGKLVIKTASASLSKTETMNIIDTDVKPGDYICLSVKDNGIGMDKETSARIFEPFFTTKGAIDRTGLGLAVVYGIVKNHNGFIRVISEPKKGSEFRVYLPVSVNAVKEASYFTKEAAKGKGEAVLIVDDEKEIRNLVKRILEKNGYKVFTASNGEEALKVFGESSKEISLVILDLIMPKTDSSEVYAEMKRIKNEIKAIISTGNARNDKIEKLIAMGAQGVIQKPYNMNKLLSCVRGAIDSKPLEANPKL